MNSKRLSKIGRSVEINDAKLPLSRLLPTVRDRLLSRGEAVKSPLDKERFRGVKKYRFFNAVYLIIVIFILLILLAVPLNGQEEEFVIDITKSSLEDLMNTSITSVSKKEEKLQGAPAAIFILTQEDIQRSGTLNIPDALRLIPGVQVAHVDANKWAVGIRGFNSRLTNKLLVLIDGRSIYNPLFSGVLWEIQDVILEDVERIEVVRGPGGTLWGANAVNGVINIITKDAKDTQGGLAVAGTGTEEKAFAQLRYGVEAAENLYLRAYGKFFERDTAFSPVAAFDETQMKRGGLRMDWHVNERNQLTVQGDIFDGEAGEPIQPQGSQDVPHSGGNALVRWLHRPGETSDITLQAYFDRTELDNLILAEKRNTFDLYFQHHFKAGDWRGIVWGVEYRRTSDRIRNSEVIGLNPDRRSDNLFSAFFQDQVSLWQNAVKFTVGSKFEHNDYSGYEIQPSARLAWALNDNHTFWASGSRAVRTPSRLETDLEFMTIRLGQDLKSEELIAYEAGCRTRPTKNLLFDVTAFTNVYDRLLTIENLKFDNQMKGKTYGIEIAGKYQVQPWWRLGGVYSHLKMDLSVHPRSVDTTTVANTEGAAPRNQAVFSSSMAIAGKAYLDAYLRYVDKLVSEDVPAYTTADIRIAWSPLKTLEVSLVGRNLLNAHHPEQTGGAVTEAERQIYGKLRWRF